MKATTVQRSVDHMHKTLLFIENHKEEVINRLFPGASERYRDEWRERDASTFWFHLDRTLQHQLLEMGVLFYVSSKEGS